MEGLLKNDGGMLSVFIAYSATKLKYH